MRSYITHKLPALLVAGFVAACGGGDAGSAGGGEAGGGEAPAAAPAIDPSTVGTISGMVSFSGTPPAPTAIDMSAEPDCAAGYGANGPMSQNVLVSNGGLANVFVYVSGAVPGAPAPSGSPTLDQQNCRYTPHVLGVRTGQNVTITNSDPVLHNIQAVPTVNRGFNISQPRQGMSTTRSFAASEVMVPVQCDVHGWMQAYIGVMDHPYFSVSGPAGRFSIPNVPAGSYTLTAWHELYGEMTAQVTVTAGATAEATFTYSAGSAVGDVPLGQPLVIEHGTESVVFERASQQ